jgi:hypothetical protein
MKDLWRFGAVSVLRSEWRQAEVVRFAAPQQEARRSTA